MGLRIRLRGGLRGSSKLGAAADRIVEGAKLATLIVSSLIIPQKRTQEGILIKSTSAVWQEIVDELGADWSNAYKLPSDKWEEFVAGAFTKEGCDVTLTPRSGDHGRDVIAIRRGVGCVKIIGSVKAYKPTLNVDYDAVRTLLGVLSGEQNASKGIIHDIRLSRKYSQRPVHCSLHANTP